MKTHSKSIFNIFMLFAFLAALTLGAATQSAPVHAADIESHPTASRDLIPVQPSMLNADGTLNLSGGTVGGALGLSGWDVTLDSKRGSVFSPTALPANTWSALTDNGLNQYVYDFAVIGYDLYVGGFFTQTSGGATTGLNYLARYNTLTNTWSVLADGEARGTVVALAVIGSDLYVGAGFSGTSQIAKYDTLTNTWSALTDNGLNNSVEALAVIGSDLYVGGGFSQTSGGATTGLNNIAKYDTITNTWSALTDNGLDNFAWALAVSGNDLYIGGPFTQTFGGVTKGLNGVAKYDTLTNTWSALTDNGLIGSVNDFAVIGSDLYLGGGFIETFGGATTGLYGVAKYDTLTNTWSALTDNGLNGYGVNALAVVGNDLYVGGQLFTRTFGGATTGLNNIARYNTFTKTWSALTDNGLNFIVNDLAVVGNDLYVGGGFTQTAGGATTGLNYIARYTLADTSSTFADVPSSYWAYNYIERLYNAGITGGCNTSPLMYCPEATVTRAQMAIFILRGIHGSVYIPPTATGTVFTDVPASYWAAAWIEQLATEGVTGGCSSGMYCPDATVTRAQMAIFLLRGEHGSAYTPPAATGTVFGDVPLGSFADAWIEQLASEGITTGCGGGNYCPDNPVTRAEMAAFLVKAFGLP